jgi:hypothetical protein
MSNPMKYIRDLEAAGFQRNQAEAQVQMVLDAIEGDLVTKSDFAVFKEHVDARFAEVGHRFNEVELRLVIKLGLITVSTTTIAVAILTWLIKIQ